SSKSGTAYTVCSMHSEPIVRRSLHDEVASRVRDMIIEGVLAPGARVYEEQLGKTLGVSRTPMREALKTLASEGLIELVNARGAVVKRFTPKDVRDMLDVLSGPGILRRAARLPRGERRANRRAQAPARPHGAALQGARPP